MLRELCQVAPAELFRESALRAWHWAEAGFEALDTTYADALAVGRRTEVFAAVP